MLVHWINWTMSTVIDLGLYSVLARTPSANWASTTNKIAISQLIWRHCAALAFGTSHVAKSFPSFLHWMEACSHADPVHLGNSVMVSFPMKFYHEWSWNWWAQHAPKYRAVKNIRWRLFRRADAFMASAWVDRGNWEIEIRKIPHIHRWWLDHG